MEGFGSRERKPRNIGKSFVRAGKKLYNGIMDERFDDDFKPRRRAKLASWMVLLLLPIALMLPSFAENLRIQLIGREVVCCDPDNRAELEARAESARANRETADTIMMVGLVGSMALATVGLLGFLVAVVRFLPGLLKVIFGLAALIVAGYIVFVSWRMYDYYTMHTEEYYQSDSWYGFQDINWYLLTN